MLKYTVHCFSGRIKLEVWIAKARGIGKLWGRMGVKLSSVDHVVLFEF